MLAALLVHPDADDWGGECNNLFNLGLKLLHRQVGVDRVEAEAEVARAAPVRPVRAGITNQADVLEGQPVSRRQSTFYLTIRPAC
jgi:hypothetical protein